MGKNYKFRFKQLTFYYHGDFNCYHLNCYHLRGRALQCFTALQCYGKACGLMMHDSCIIHSGLLEEMILFWTVLAVSAHNLALYPYVMLKYAIFCFYSITISVTSFILELNLLLHVGLTEIIKYSFSIGSVMAICSKDHCSPPWSWCIYSGNVMHPFDRGTCDYFYSVLDDVCGIYV